MIKDEFRALWTTHVDIVSIDSFIAGGKGKVSGEVIKNDDSLELSLEKPSAGSPSRRVELNNGSPVFYEKKGSYEFCTQFIPTFRSKSYTPGMIVDTESYTCAASDILSSLSKGVNFEEGVTHLFLRNSGSHGLIQFDINMGENGFRTFKLAANGDLYNHIGKSLAVVNDKRSCNDLKQAYAAASFIIKSNVELLSEYENLDAFMLGRPADHYESVLRDQMQSALEYRNIK